MPEPHLREPKPTDQQIEKQTQSEATYQKNHTIRDTYTHAETKRCRNPLVKADKVAEKLANPLKLPKKGWRR
jgi:hypothetical protein